MDHQANIVVIFKDGSSLPDLGNYANQSISLKYGEVDLASLNPKVVMIAEAESWRVDSLRTIRSQTKAHLIAEYRDAARFAPWASIANELFNSVWIQRHGHALASIQTYWSLESLIRNAGIEVGSPRIEFELSHRHGSDEPNAHHGTKTDGSRESSEHSQNLFLTSEPKTGTGKRPDISVILATKGRPEMARRVIDKCLSSPVPYGKKVEIIAVLSEHSDFPYEILGVRKVLFTERIGAVPAAEAGIVQSRGEFCILLNDDIEINTEDWLVRLWCHREKGMVYVNDGDLFSRNIACAPFPFFPRRFYMENCYPQPYRVFAQDDEIYRMANLSEELGIYRAPDIDILHTFREKDRSTKLRSVSVSEYNMLMERLNRWKSTKLPVLGILTFRSRGSDRPLVLKRCIENLMAQEAHKKCKIIVYDDGSTDPEQIRFLSSMKDTVVHVTFWDANLGPNGNTCRFLKRFFECETKAWILINDDVVFERPWIDDVLQTMTIKPHLYIEPLHGDDGINHPHGFLMTGSFELLKEVGPYDLKKFPMGYGDAHAHWSKLAMRRGLAVRYKPPVQADLILGVPPANPKLQRDFKSRRKELDQLVEDTSLDSIPWNNGSPELLKPTKQFRQEDFIFGVKTFVENGRDDRFKALTSTIDTLVQTVGYESLIVCDDGSRDSRVAKFLSSGRWRTIFLNRNIGAPSCHNALVRTFLGMGRECLITFDDDLVFHQGWLDLVILKMNKGREHWHSYGIAPKSPSWYAGGYLLTFTRDVISAIGGAYMGLGRYGLWHEHLLERAISCRFSKPIPDSGIDFSGFIDVSLWSSDKTDQSQNTANPQDYNDRYHRRDQLGKLFFASLKEKGTYIDPETGDYPTENQDI